MAAVQVEGAAVELNRGSGPSRDGAHLRDT